MTSRTTAEELQVSKSTRIAYVILVEGIGIAFTTSEDLAGVAAAWEGTAWDADDATWLPTAFRPGSWSQKIEFFNPKIRADSLSFEIADRTDYLAGLVFGNHSYDARTWLTADLNSDEDAVEVVDTSSFAVSGPSYIYIGNETILVDSGDQTPTGWTNVGRAQFALHATEDDLPFATAHRLNRINGSAPRVTDKPVTWVNRKVAIYAHHYEAGSRSWSTAEQAALVWEGFLRNPVDSGKRSIVFTAVHVMSMLQRDLLGEQFTADVAQGRELPAGKNYVSLLEAEIGSTYLSYEGTFAPGWYRADDLIATLNTILVPATTGLAYAWTLARASDGRVRLRIQSQPGAAVPTDYRQSAFSMALSWWAWDLLGFRPDGTEVVKQSAGVTYYIVRLEADYLGGTNVMTPVYYQRTAELTPIKYEWPTSHADGDPTFSLQLDNVTGEWLPQPAAGLPPNPYGLEGYVRFGDLEIIGGTYDAVTKRFRVTHRVVDQFGIGFAGHSAAIQSGPYREANSPGDLKALQIWYEKAPLPDILLRLLLSTGSTSYNSGDWDVNPPSMGAAVPWSLLDLDTWKTLPRQDAWVLFLAQPTELSRLLESALATYNRYAVWRRGQIALVEPRVDGPTIATAYVLTEDNKADPRDREQAEQAVDGIINRVELKWNRDIGGSFRSQQPIEDAVSASDFGGLQRTISVEAWGIQNGSTAGLPEALAQFAGKVLAYFSRPMTIVERTINKSLIQVAPGDTVLLSSSYLVDPATGRRGLTSYPAWVVSADFSPEGMKGKVRLAYSGEFNASKVCAWAWSALVNHDAAGGGYTVVDPSNRYVEVLPDEYRGAGQAADDTGPVAGDKLLIRERSPSDARAPLTWHVTVASVNTTTHRIYLTATIAGWDSGRQYLVTPDAITTPVQNGQRVNTFLADRATDSTGYLPTDSYVLGTPRFLAPQGDAPTDFYIKPPEDGSIDEPGQPLCVADVVDAMRSANNVLAWRTRHLVWSQVWDHNAAFTSTADRELVAGPIRVPLFAHGSRSLLVRLYGKTSNAATPAVFTITTSREMPQGAFAVLGVHFPDAAQARQVTVQTDSTTLEWLDEVEVPCSPEPGREPPAVWLSIECETGDAGESGELHGVSIFEASGP